jgi:hypothetical protein
MPPAPARIAAMPTTRSRAPWNPAVPPPPVTGAAVGYAVTVRVMVGLGVAVAVVVRVGVGVAVVVVVVTAGDGLSPELGDTPAEPLAVMVTEAEPDTVTEGVKIAGVVVDVPDVQPEITTEAMMAKAPQPIAVNRTLRAVPAMVVRTLIKPSSCACPAANPCPVLALETAPGRETHDDLDATQAGRRQIFRNANDHKGNAHERHRHAMARRPGEY